MLILLAHEMGHYLCCRYYGVNATLPFFIPAPTLIGTLGAFIRIRSPIRSRAALFDIGIAGPIAGFAVAVTVLMFALPLSKPMPPDLAGPDIQLGYPLIFRLVWYILPLTQLKASAGSALHSIYFHPTAIAAWVGMFATALNLLARRSTGWWTHRVLSGSAGAQDGVALNHSRAYSHGALFLGRMVDLGNFIENQRHAASHGRGMAGGDRSPPLVGRIRSADADINVGASALRA